MKHCAKCRLEKHLRFLNVKKAGLAGVILVGLHLSFHLIELLILPSILLAFGSHAVEEPAMATTHETEYLELALSLENISAKDSDSAEQCARDVLTPEHLSIQLPSDLDVLLCAPNR